MFALFQAYFDSAGSAAVHKQEAGPAAAAAFENEMVTALPVDYKKLEF